MKMRKRMMALVLLTVMALSLISPAAAAGGNSRVATLPGKLGGTVTLEIRPTQTNEVAVGINDAWVTFSVYLTPEDGAEVPAFSFTLKPDDGMVLSEAMPGYPDEHRYSLNDIPCDPHGGTMDYNPATKYYGIGGITTPLPGKTWVMDMPVKLTSDTSQGEYFLDVVTNSDVANENFTVGESSGDQYTRMVMAFPLHVIPGVSISGTVCDDSGVTMANAKVLLRQDGNLINTVYSNASGTYKFEDISTGSYEVEAVSADGKKGSVKVTVAAVDVTEQDVTVRDYKLGDVNMDGVLNTKDVTRLRQHLKTPGEYPLSDYAKQLGNVNNDDSLNSKDVTRLRQHLKTPGTYPLG